MSALTVGGLYERVRAVPSVHLGERAPRTLFAYKSGYDAGLFRHAGGLLMDELAGGLAAWVNARVVLTDEHESRLNARSCISPASYALLMAADEAEALDVYIELWTEALAEFRAEGGLPQADKDWLRRDPARTSVIQQLMFMRRRPGMFFGSPHVSNLWAFANGFRWAERDLGCDSIETARLQAFQAWVDERYPVGQGGNWARTFRFLAMSEPEREYDTFWTHFDMFFGGAAADAPDPAEESMLAAIVEHAKTLDGGEDHIPTEVAEFAARAQSFCELVDSSGSLELWERLRRLAERLAELYAAGLRLPDVGPADDAAAEGSYQPRWAGAGEHSVYWEQLDPYDAAEPVAGALDDDVQDIYNDIQRGLASYERDWASAVREWRFHLRAHWGAHAVDALRALQRII